MAEFSISTLPMWRTAAVVNLHRIFSLLAVGSCFRLLDDS
jgi:hypothetical protein